jgi:glycosyltransferase involved in cell wall biosynthesis
MPRGLIRVVHVVNQLDMGGMEKLLVEFARHADRDRFALHFVSLAGRGDLADEIEAHGWKVTALDYQFGLHPGLVLRFAGLFRRLRADIVHAHNSRPLLYAGPAARLAGAWKVICTRHNARTGTPRRLTALTRLASLTADRVVCVSSASARVALAEGIAPRRIRTLLNGIDPTRFRPAEGDGPVVAVGRLSPEKDFATLIRAAGQAARHDPTFRLVIAGSGPCDEGLRRLVAEQNLGGTVALLGQVRDVPSLLAGGRAFALSSLTEGVSIAILEAMAAQLPVVATRVGGNPEIVADGRTGRLVPPSDPAALAGALLELWLDPDRRRSMGRAGRERVVADFDVRKVVARYEAMYLEGRGPRGQPTGAGGTAAPARPAP